MSDTAAETKKIAKIMRDLDFCMFTTFTKSGDMFARPMSNNRNVEYDGDVWFFSPSDSRLVAEIQSNPRTQLSYMDTKQFRFISMSGSTEIVRDVAKKRALWEKSMEQWFPDGPESENVVLLKVRPTLIAYWTGEGDGEFTVE